MLLVHVYICLDMNCYDLYFCRNANGLIVKLFRNFLSQCLGIMCWTCIVTAI
uniref:Uncharacterized protein n=1 Tax=Picea sitchensis TaxID=3332 RepID=A9NSK4_PICSI|nr:unknown [Picea sitchensis]